MITSLLGENIIKIASGGVHNVCLSETPTTLKDSLIYLFQQAIDCDFLIKCNDLTIKTHKLAMCKSEYLYDYIFTKKNNYLDLNTFNSKNVKLIIDYLYSDNDKVINLLNSTDDIVEIVKISK